MYEYVSWYVTDRALPDNLAEMMTSLYGPSKSPKLAWQKFLNIQHAVARSFGEQCLDRNEYVKRGYRAKRFRLSVSIGANA